MLSPTIAAPAAIAITSSIESEPSEASTEEAISAVSPGKGTPLASAPTSSASRG